ncbi:DNA-binding response regulator [Actinophytocola sp.]|uniref:helix-turn-helix transcriptional regulator n=1 Tax=Actinophytocola sp. TaxID=1872138 RepID=UPI00389AA065
MEARAHVAVLDPLPLFQRGVVDALASEGIRVETPDDIRVWSAQNGRRVIILTLVSQEDWTLLGHLSAKALVIAVLEKYTTALSIRALRLGASSVVPRNTTSAVMRRAVDAALVGDVIVSRAVIDALISSSPRDSGEPRLLGQEEVLWLRRLASGTTVAHLAELAGYSERTMYRLLNSIYDRLGVANRTEALIKAHAYGWLGAEP